MYCSCCAIECNVWCRCVVLCREILSKAIDSRTGKGIPLTTISHLETSNKDALLEEVRLRNIGLKMALHKLEKTRKSREQLAEGLHMIDFEQVSSGCSVYSISSPVEIILYIL
jgi:hypothetical protein